MLISNPLEKFLKKCTQKVLSKTILMNMSKSEKSAYFRHIFANNFFVIFFKTFSKDSESAWNSAFFDTHIKFFNTINFFGSI